MNEPRIRQWQNATVLLLCIGYAGYYFCRSNLSVATPLLIDAFHGQGIDKKAIGAIASWGTLAYAFGKLFNGVLCDFVGGRRMFLFGMVASIVCTLLFGWGAGLGLFTAVWVANRLVQSMGWAALVKVTSNWFAFDRYGSVMGWLSLSFLFGDALARWVLGGFIKGGMGWRGVFFSAAAVLAVIAVVNFVLLRDNPRQVGAPEPEVNPNNLFGERGSDERPHGLLELLMPFFSSFDFWVVAVMSFGLTLIRETFNTWTPTYLNEVVKMSKGDAAQYSLVGPLAGGVAVLVAGYITDRFTRGNRGLVSVVSLVALVGALLALAGLHPGEGIVVPLAAIAVANFLLIGPYSFLAGAISLDMGGKRGSSTAAGLVDSAGYFGGVLSGYGVASVAEHSGWGAAFALLAGAAALTCVAAGVYWLRTRARHAVPVNA